MATREPGVAGESRTTRNRVENAITTSVARVPKLGESRYIISGNERFPIEVSRVIPEGENTRVWYRYPGERTASIFTIYDRNGRLISPRNINIK